MINVYTVVVLHDWVSIFTFVLLHMNSCNYSMVKFSATILKFNEQGEKTGWSYIEIKQAVAHKLKPDNKKSFRVKGKLDEHPIKSVALVPMGGGDFIMAINATMRKAIGKQKGATLKVEL